MVLSKTVSILASDDMQNVAFILSFILSLQCRPIAVGISV